MGRVSRFVNAVKQAVEQREVARRETSTAGETLAVEDGPLPVPRAGALGQSVVVERRAGTRRACRGRAYSQPRVAPRGLVWEAVLQDVSRHGVGLVLTDRCRKGTVLQLDLPCGRVPRTLLARVTRTEAQANGWFHGCELLIPLTRAELEQLSS